MYKSCVAYPYCDSKQSFFFGVCFKNLKDLADTNLLKFDYPKFAES
jgi:hypothetical protein